MLRKENLHNVYLGLGSNLGDKAENINRAVKNIEERIGNLIACSAFYVTDPVGFTSDNQFLNAVCHIRTERSPLEILEITQEIEKELGRKSKSANKVYADRTIDIDILLFDDQIIDYPRLILPHPHLHERPFVLVPLAEIAGELLHPVLKKTMGELKLELKD